MRAYLGIDLHRRRSMAVCLDEDRERLWWLRFDNSPETLARVVAEAGPAPEVVLEATFGWYWAADVIAEDWWPGASGASVGGEGVYEPADEERLEGRHLVGGDNPDRLKSEGSWAHLSASLHCRRQPERPPVTGSTAAETAKPTPRCIASC